MCERQKFALSSAVVPRSFQHLCLLRLQALNISRSQPNFASFIGRGSQHVVTQDDGMYERSDGDVKFADWLTDLIAGNPLPQNVDCDPDCA